MLAMIVESMNPLFNGHFRRTLHLINLMQELIERHCYEHYQVYKETRRGLEVFAKLLLPVEVEFEAEVEVEVEEEEEGDTSVRESRPLLE